jgi:ubiquinone/menaquinone biosynthesis C-methylase UbiE
VRGRFPFVVWDGGGNVLPALALGRRLAQRGHAVRVLAPQALRERMTAAGCVFRGFERTPTWDPALGRAFVGRTDAVCGRKSAKGHTPSVLNTGPRSGKGGTTMDRDEQEKGWGSDFFGTLNDLPAEPVHAIGQVLEAMNSEPAFRQARRAMLQEWRLAGPCSVLEAGCGTGVSLDDLKEILPPGARVVGIDPTVAFVESARRRAAAGGVDGVEYAVGDIRRIPYADGTFDAAFCDKVLLHAGPAQVALRELARVVRPGGWIGAVEWQPAFVLSTTRPDVEGRVAEMFRKAVYDFWAAPNLPRYFREAGLTDVRTRAFLAYGERLDHPPFWRAFLIQQVPLFVHAGLLGAGDGDAFVADLEALDARGEFRGSFVVQMAVGRKAA